MAWWRIDDGAADHPKFLALEELGPARYAAAVALWFRAGCYSAKQRLDGEVPSAFVGRSTSIPRRKRAATDLVQVGLWLEAEDGWEFNDWSSFNPTSDERSAKRRAKTERQRRWREKKRAEEEAAAAARVDASTASTRDAAPIPTRPDPTTSSTEEVPSGSPEPASAPSPLDVIREHEERFGKDLARAARDAVGLSRKTGKIADTVWARTLAKLAGHGDRAAVDALRVFVERYADGDKGEGYLVAIARSMAKGTGSQARIPGVSSPAGIASFDEVEQDGRDQFAAQVAEDRRRRGSG